MHWERGLGWGILLFVIDRYHFCFLCLFVLFVLFPLFPLFLSWETHLYFIFFGLFDSVHVGVRVCVCSFVFVIIFLILCLPFVCGLSFLFLVGFLVCLFESPLMP